MNIYKKGAVTVDANFARFGSKAYAISKINSVEVRIEKRDASMGYLLGYIGAFLGIFAGISMISEGNLGGVIAILIGIGLGGLAYMTTPKSAPPAIHRLYLMMSNNEAQAYETTDGEEVRHLREAIEDAIAGRRHEPD